MPLTREIAARLAAAGELVILQRGVEIAADAMREIELIWKISASAIQSRFFELYWYLNFSPFTKKSPC